MAKQPECPFKIGQKLVVQAHRALKLARKNLSLAEHATAIYAREVAQSSDFAKPKVDGRPGFGG